MPRRRYPPRAILEALIAYHLGHTIEATRAQVLKRTRTRVPASTLHSWIGQFASVCTFSRRYLRQITENCPNELFQGEGARCSDGNLPQLALRLISKETNAQALAKLGLLLAKRSKDRHPAIQHFMLATDSATVAVEVPVYLYPAEAPDLGLDGVLTGHIDVLQIRGNRVWILDYKPDARRERYAKYQIYLYARALSVRIGIPLKYFAMAYFDDKDYFEVVVPN